MDKSYKHYIDLTPEKCIAYHSRHILLKHKDGSYYQGRPINAIEGILSDEIMRLRSEAEAAKARAAELLESNRELSEALDIVKAERNTAWTELRVIRKEIGADDAEATSDEVTHVFNTLKAERDELSDVLNIVKCDLSEALNKWGDEQMKLKRAQNELDASSANCPKHSTAAMERIDHDHQADYPNANRLSTQTHR